MTVATGYRYDVFVSFSHVDNAPDDGGKAWVDQLREHLLLALRMQFGVNGAPVFFDHLESLDEGALHRSQSEALMQCALFVAVVSPAYVAGRWTRQELETFVRSADDPERLVVVERLPVEDEDWPPELVDPHRIQFWRPEPDRGGAVPLSPENDKARYYARVGDLATTLKMRLIRMRDAASRPTPTAGAAPTADFYEGSVAPRPVPAGENAEPMPAGPRQPLPAGELVTLRRTQPRGRSSPSAAATRPEAVPEPTRYPMPTTTDPSEANWDASRTTAAEYREWAHSRVPRTPPRQRRSRRVWVYAAAGIAIVVAAWLLRREIAAGAAALVDLFRSAAPPLPAVPANSEDQADCVDVSAFAPSVVAAGDHVLVQILCHLADDAEVAKAMAVASDPDAARVGVTTLQAFIPRGTRLTVALEAGGLPVEDAVQHLTWRGAPRACQFYVAIPASPVRSYPVTARLFIDGLPVGLLRFKLKVASAAQSRSAHVAMKGDEARRYRRAFLSYSTQDRVEVLKRAQALRAARIAFFQDLLSLEPGQRWEARLYEEIDNCDLFLLFWSSHAAQSEWVLKEAEYALRHQRDSGTAMPEITPVLLEGPPVPLPPPSLRDIHFNDYIAYVIAAAEQEKQPD